MAAYPPGPSRLFSLPDLAGGQAPGDLAYLVDVSLGTNAGDPSDVKSTLNDLFEEITKNITDLSLGFGNGAAATVSAASKGKVRYNATVQSFQVSENGGAYENLLKGTGLNQQVTYWTAADTVAGDTAFVFDPTNDRVGIGITVAAAVTTLNVRADSGAIAQEWRSNTPADTTRAQFQVTSSDARVGMSSAHAFYIITSNTERISVESGGAVAINRTSPAQAQLHVDAATNATTGLLVNNFAASAVEIAIFQVNGSNRARLTQNGEWILGLAATQTGKLTLSNSAGATLTSLSAGNAATTLNYIWPAADPTVGQFLQAAAPSGGNVTMSWATAVTGPASPSTSVQFNDGGVFGGDASFVWDKTNDRLGIGITLAAAVTTLNVRADSGAIAQEWRSNTPADTTRAQFQVTSSDARVGMSSTHTFYIITNNTERITVESGGAVAINRTSPAQAQLHVDAATNVTTGLLVNNFAASSVEIAIFQVNGSNRARLTQNGEWILGLASTVSGKLTLSNSAGATLTSLSAGNAASTLNFIWPVVDPTLGQVLSAAAPSGGNVVLSWATAGGGTPAAPANSVQYNNAGAFGGNAGLLYIPGSTTGNELALASATITSGNLFSIAMTGTAATSNTKTGLNISSSGANATNAQTVFGSQISVTNTNATSGTNIALQLTASGATTANTALNVTAGAIVQTSNLAAAFVSGPNGATNPVLTLVNNIASQAAGLSITGNAATAGVILRVISSGTNEPLILNAKGNRYASFADDSFGTSQSTFNTASWSGGQIGWVSASALGAVALDTGTARHAAAVVRITNGSTGLGSILIGASTDSLTGNFTVMGSNAATNAIVDIARLGVNSTGTAAAGFGGRLSFSAESSTTNDSQVAGEQWFWNDATHATRTGALSWSIVNNATVSEYLRLTTAGGGGTFVNTAACLAVHEGTAPAIWTAGSYSAKLYLIGAAAAPATGVAANFSTTILAGPVWQMLRGRGTNASPAAIQSGDVMGEIQWNGQFNTSTNNQTTGAAIRAVATETWASGLNGTDLFFYTSVTGGTIAEKMSLRNTGTLRINATSGTFNTTTLLQIGNYASWNTDVVAAIYSGADGTKGLEVIGTAGQTANLFRVFRDTVTPDLFRVSAAAGSQVRCGLATGANDYAFVGGTAKVNTTPVGNIGGGEDNLMTYSLPASSLGTNLDYVIIDAWGSFAANANNKTVKLYFGATVLFDSTAFGFNGTDWRVYAKVVRTGATTQIAVATFFSDPTLLGTITTCTSPGETLSGAVVIKCTGTSGSSVTDDIVQKGLIVQWFPVGQG